MKGEFRKVSTTEKDESTGYFQCNAEISVGLPSGEVISREIAYEISRIESEDADFQVSAAQAEIDGFRALVNGQINRERDQAESDKRHDELASAYSANAPVPLTDQEAEGMIRRQVSERRDGLDPTKFVVISTDLNSDGYKEYVAMWGNAPDSNTMDKWHVQQFWQKATGPGKKTELKSAIDTLYYHELTRYELNGNVLTVFGEGEDKDEYTIADNGGVLPF